STGSICYFVSICQKPHGARPNSSSPDESPDISSSRFEEFSRNFLDHQSNWHIGPLDIGIQSPHSEERRPIVMTRQQLGGYLTARHPRWRSSTSVVVITAIQLLAGSVSVCAQDSPPSPDAQPPTD